MKTSELIGAALDGTVAMCEGNIESFSVQDIGGPLWANSNGESIKYGPSTGWAEGGSIIERESILLDKYPDGGWVKKMLGSCINTFSRKSRITIPKLQIANHFGTMPSALAIFSRVDFLAGSLSSYWALALCEMPRRRLTSVLVREVKMGVDSCLINQPMFISLYFNGK